LFAYVRSLIPSNDRTSQSSTRSVAAHLAKPAVQIHHKESNESAVQICHNQPNESKLIHELESAKQASGKKRKIADAKYAVTFGGCKSKVKLVRETIFSNMNTSWGLQ
jgi:hypothetical protein